jgi:beta-lactam-binding protein with PASTA domain
MKKHGAPSATSKQQNTADRDTNDDLSTSPNNNDNINDKKVTLSVLSKPEKKTEHGIN